MPDPRAATDVARLVEEHHEAVYRYAYRLAGTQADAEDLSQQTFLVAQQKIGQVREADKVRGWLFTVLRSCWLKSRRRRVPVPSSTLELEMDHLPEATEEEIDREGLQAALDELPDDYKLVLVMFYFEQCSYREIAEKLDLPMGTVMSRLSRAKAGLRRRLFPEAVQAAWSEPKRMEPNRGEP